MKKQTIINGVLSLLGLVLFVYLAFVFIVYINFSTGCGWDDGPFEGKLIDKNTLLKEELVLPVRNGKIIIDN